MWMYPVIADEAASEEFWGQIETDFEAAHETVDLTIELQPWEGRQEKITTALASGTGPDIVLLGPDQMPQYVEQDTLAAVDDVIEDTDVELRSNAVEDLTIDGSVYGVPIYQTVVTTTYNQAVFDDAGISELPTTWDDVLAAAPKLAENGVAVLDYAGSPEVPLNHTFFSLLWQAGGDVFTEDGSAVAFDGPEGIAALQFLLDLQEAGGLPEDVVSTTGALESLGMPTGDSAMIISTKLVVAERIAEAIGPDNLVVGSPLEGPNGQATFGIPGGLVLADKAADNEGARAFLRFMQQPDVLAGVASETGFFPPSDEIDVPDAHEYAAKFEEAVPLAKPGAVHPKARQVMAILSAQIQNALLGNMTAEEALAAAADEANALLDEQG